MLRMWRAVRVAVPRRALSTSSSSSSQAAAAGKRAADSSITDAGVEALNATTPGITRIRKGSGAGRVVEVDSTIARIIGSDWGDRRNQSVSLPMRIYWIIFGVVLANGVYTYFTGRDESYLVEKVQKKVDEKLGVVETNEFVVMADPLPSETSEAPKVPALTKSQQPVAVTAPSKSAPVSVLAASSGAATMPFFHPSTQPQVARPRSKAELQTQLQQLRATQQQLRAEIASGKSFRDLDDLEVEIRLLDQQKTQLKRMIKRV